MTPAATALVAALALAHAAGRSAGSDAPRTPRGTVGSVEIVYRDAPLRAKALRDANAPILVRVTALGADRYRIDYIGAVAGAFDLLPAIERVDGRAPEGLAPLPVEIFTQLPPNAGTDVFGIPARTVDFSAHYTSLVAAVALMWAAVPAAFLVRRALRRRDAKPSPPPQREPTVAELLFAAVDAARTRELDAAERGQLELRLLRVLRDGAAGARTDTDTAAAVAALRADPQTAAIVRAVESWLHAPEGGDAARAIAELERLRPTASPPGGAP